MSQHNERITELERENALLKSQIESLNKIQNEKDFLQEEYNNSQNRFKTIFDESSFGNKIIDEELVIIQVNAALMKILGYDKTELLGRKIIEFTHPEFVSEWEKLRIELWSPSNHRTSFSIDTCLIKKDKSVIWCHVTSILFLDNGNCLGYTIFEDITVRKEADRVKDELVKREHLLELKNQEQKQQQELFEVTIRTQEEERERIAEQLHNSLGQMLYTVKLNLAQLKLKEHGDKERIEQVDKVERLLSESIVECRRTSHSLLPALLKDFGLKVAIEDMCGQLNVGIKVKCKFECTNPIQDKYVEVVVFRTIQELLLNVVKHAEATEAFCKVSVSEDSISITVEDNGKGFISTETKGKGIGLSAIKSRIGLMRGNVEISSKINGGTKVAISLGRK